MSTSTEYLARAEECVRLANVTKDEILQQAILTLRQQYLQTAARLQSIESSEETD